MKEKLETGLLVLAITGALMLTTPVLADSGLLGNWSCNSGASTINFTGPNTLVFNGEQSSYQVMYNNILVQEDYGFASYPYQLSGGQLAIQFPDGTLMQCSKGTASAPQRQARATQPGGNNASLAQQIAGIWWGYAGSTERKIGLCPGGRYMDYTESGYSGHSYDSTGAETMAWGTASQGGNSGQWTIQGDTQSGVISVQTNSGSSFTLHYRQIGDPGCLDINGNRLCRTSATCQ